MAQDLGGDATAHKIGTPALARPKRWLEARSALGARPSRCHKPPSRVVRSERELAMRGPSNTDLPLLPQVLTGYIPSVDLDATVAALAPRLVAYATGRTGCRSTGQDIAQEALAALVLRWRRFGPPESPEAFVFAVARRRAGRAMKRRALLKPLDFILAARASDTGVDSYEQRAELQLVIRTMKRLRRAEREVLLLRAAGELSLDQIAIVTRSSVGAVKMRLHRARARLMELLEEAPHAR